MPRSTPIAQPSRRQLLLAAASFGAASLLAGCGGGGDADVTETPASFTTGPITGFGSVIVGGVRFDDSAALLIDEDGERCSRDDLKLGVVVDIDAGTVNRAERRARALRIALGGALVGPVNAVDTGASTLTLLGQTVLVTTSTVFDDALAGGLAAVTLDSVLEVHGLYDRANQRFLATRVEPKPDAVAYRLRGVVSGLDADARTFRIGSELISYAGVPDDDDRRPLANGQFVRVRLQTAQVDGAWVATRLHNGVRLPDPRPEAHVEGVITRFASTADFDVNGLPVDANGASFPDGTTGVVLGARVEVSGAVVDGVLVATKVETEERRDLGRRTLEFHGRIGNLDPETQTFALRGLTVWYGGTVVYEDGNEGDLANDALVEVRGVISADRTRIEARRIEFK